MGKLAERLADAQRSGVYRVETTEALEEAAAINRFPLVRLALDRVAAADLRALWERALVPGLGGSWRALTRALADPAWRPAPGHVVLVRGFEALACSVPPAFDALLEALRTVAAERAARGQPFYATFVDPGACLPLGPLFNWHRQSQPTRSNTKSLPRGVTP